ncbi:MAG: hypothetical protein QGG40_18140, partial [Myxococcota bacterium]|nr:hypothetical protein [Myxococcota bacterium]
RIILKGDGQVQVIGHALPQVEILQFHQDEKLVPREDSFRYCPPERIEAAPENLTSDLFSLGLIAFELMTGRPVYDGLVNDIRQQAARGEGSRRLFRFREVLPQSVRDLLAQVLKPQVEDRIEDGDAFIDAVQAVLSGPDAAGSSLMDVMSQVSNMVRRTGVSLEGGRTMMVSRDALKDMVEPEDSSRVAKGRARGVRASGRRSRRSRKVAEQPDASLGGAAELEVTGKTDAELAAPRSEDAQEEQSAASEPEPAVSKVSKPKRGGRTSDLLEAIRSSGTRKKASTVHTEAQDRSREKAADVIDTILKASGTRSPLRDQVREARGKVERGEPLTPEEEPPSPKVTVGRTPRRPRRSRKDPETKEAPDVGTDVTAESAGDTDSRDDAPVSGSSQDAPVQSPPVTETEAVAPDAPAEESAPTPQQAEAPVEEPAPAPRDNEPSVEQAAPVQESEPGTRGGSPDPEPGSTSTSLSGPDSSSASATAGSAPPVVTEDEDTLRVIPPVSSSWGDLGAPPRPLPVTSRGTSQSFVIARGSDSGTLRLRLPVDATVGEAVARLVGNMVP